MKDPHAESNQGTHMEKERNWDYMEKEPIPATSKSNATTQVTTGKTRRTAQMSPASFT